MERTPPSSLNPIWLPAGTVVGNWRVVTWAGRGVYGTVYQALPVGPEHAEPVALKVAMHPRDPRFTREVELLSRLRHPNVPCERASPEVPTPSWLPRFSLAAAALALAVWAWWIAPSSTGCEHPAAQTAAVSAEQRDAGTSGLGEAAAVVSLESSPKNAAQAMVPEEKLPEPLPDQTHPTTKGRCPHKQQVALNGGCWVETPLESDKCEALNGQIFRGTCYVPVFLPGHSRPPTSCPADKK